MALLLSVKAKRGRRGFMIIERQIVGEISEKVNEAPLLALLLEKFIHEGILPDPEREIAS